MSSLCEWISPDSKREKVWSQQRGNKNEENIGGEDASLHHLCLSDTEGALLLRVLKHKLSAEKEERGVGDKRCGSTEIERWGEKNKNKQR